VSFAFSITSFSLPIASNLYHRLKQIVFLRRSKGLSMHDYLMFIINHRHSIVSLYHSMRCLHLGTFIVCYVALHGRAELAGFVIIILQPLFYLLYFFPKSLPLYRSIPLMHWKEVCIHLSQTSLCRSSPFHRRSIALREII
jgi:hypothetical protein